MAKVAFIGLGVMGFPMAGHLASAGHEVCVYNRTAAKAENWCKQHAGRHAATPAEAAKGADVVFTCVGNDDDLRQVTLGQDGALSGMSAGSILVDHTTASADVARELAHEAQARNIDFLDAPVSGGQAGAENGRLSVMLGGEQATYDQASKVFDCYAASHRLLGPAGSGQLAKMVNQIAIAGLVQGLSEAVHFVKQSGLDGEAVFDVIQHGAAGSWQMVNRHKTMLEGEYDFGFAVDWMRKDLNIALNEARKNGAQLPVTALVDQFYADVQAGGGGRLDTSSLLKRLEKGQ
ncbi:NAD(P)-dependent oxidoreductase [Marinobacterium sp. AK62]|uniref:NAD(P)-dependent oxidoreductase n=1 Tax=Marinobacterium alkalitolerans TaxID=1542925 RepID=A0ABS3ZBW5_9GAMM|nr:NAD(P)-dependent oxidoreductase [Marinobacterium alkalitolerans]MBP0049197.1 NAD(P)-dependent oxidoreductase [Marinobacterium alkalitolerans]